MVGTALWAAQLVAMVALIFAWLRARRAGVRGRQRATALGLLGLSVLGPVLTTVATSVHLMFFTAEMNSAGDRATVVAAGLSEGINTGCFVGLFGLPGLVLGLFGC